MMIRKIVIASVALLILASISLFGVVFFIEGSRHHQSDENKNLAETIALSKNYQLILDERSLICIFGEYSNTKRIINKYNLDKIYRLKYDYIREHEWYVFVHNTQKEYHLLFYIEQFQVKRFDFCEFGTMIEFRNDGNGFFMPILTE